MHKILLVAFGLLCACCRSDAFIGGVGAIDARMAPKGMKFEPFRPKNRNFDVVNLVRTSWRKAFPGSTKAAIAPALSSASHSQENGTDTIMRGPSSNIYARLTRLSNMLTSLFPLWVLTAVIVALVKPTALAWLKGDLITIFVGATMVFTGMTLEVDDFLKILKQPSQVQFMRKSQSEKPAGILRTRSHSYASDRLRRWPSASCANSPSCPGLLSQSPASSRCPPTSPPASSSSAAGTFSLRLFSAHRPPSAMNTCIHVWMPVLLCCRGPLENSSKDRIGRLQGGSTGQDMRIAGSI